MKDCEKSGFSIIQSIRSFSLLKRVDTSGILFETRARVFVDSQRTTLYVKAKMALIRVVSGVENFFKFC